MEYLDTYDEQGNFIKKEDRKIVHELGLWHNTVHCWLYDKLGNIYFQIRSDEKNFIQQHPDMFKLEKPSKKLLEEKFMKKSDIK